MIILYQPKVRYSNRIRHYQKLHNRLTVSSNRYVWLKVLTILGGLGIAALGLFLKYYLLSGGAIILGIALLIFWDHFHHRIILRQKFTDIFIEINAKSLRRLDDGWHSFKDTGSEFLDDQHPFAKDLDIFGQASLFQWINSTYTFWGRKKLAWLLASPAPDAITIRQRQIALAELASNPTWRQWLSAYGISIADQIQDPAPLITWAKEPGTISHSPVVVWAVRFLTVLVTISIGLALFTHWIPPVLPWIGILINLLLLRWKRREREQILSTAGVYQKNLELYRNLLCHIEGRPFQSAYLQNLKSRLINTKKQSVSQQLQRLVRIIDSIANRNNAFYGLVNLITLWDYHSLFALEDWKSESGQHLQDWLETIGEFESLASLALIRYDHPDWAVPEIVEGNPVYLAREIGHPLLSGNERIANDLRLDDESRVMLITGSNMSGKSTLLRTAGINLALAYMGSPVCARSLQCSVMDIYTCMRVSDNLEKNISSFYAELLRIKTIISASSGLRPLFFLLDEIFKGTNSIDRHNGAKILIKKLLQSPTMGFVSTHDLELGELEQESPQVKNYHFQEFFVDEQLCFDYRLRPGISTTRNAIYLMRAAGIDIPEESVIHD